jgi:thiosulfate/3-mercaptopyruvate sulfurtransferase
MARTRSAPRPTLAPRPPAARRGDPPGPLVSAEWLEGHLNDKDLRVVHVAPNRRGYNRGHIPGAVYSDLHRELALRGRAPETGDAEREWLIPTREQTEAVLRRWGVGEGDRVVLCDDVGLNRHAIRGYWLLRLYRFPADRVHVVDGGIKAWKRVGGATTKEVPEPDLTDARRRPVKLGARDKSLIADHDEVVAWSSEADRDGGPTRILDVRTIGEYVGTDLRARRGGHIPGARQRLFSDFLTDEGTFRPVQEILAMVRASGAEPGDIRATYCQGGVRAALAWFALHELAGLKGVKSYAGSWEEWGNRSDCPVEAPG